MITNKEFNLVSQISHTGWGLAITFAGKALLLGYWYLIFAGIYIAYALIKEFWYDSRYETPDVRGSNLEDFLFALLGTIIAIILILLHSY
jgi:hypothetical protein